MFKKDDIIVSLGSMIPDWYDDDYKLLMGGALVMYGVRPCTHDLDIDVTDKLFDYLFDMFGMDDEDITIKNGQRRMVIYTGYGEIEVYAGTFETDSGFDVYERIESVRCQTLGDIVKMKRHFGREKDFDDIIMIEKWVLQNS